MKLPEGSFNPELVKVSHFTRQGFKLNGVVHVGANIGYEIQFYFALGIKKVMAFEPLLSALDVLMEDWLTDERVEIYAYALGDVSTVGLLNVSEGDGQGSTLLKEIGGPYTWGTPQNTAVHRFDEVFREGIDGYDTLVVDVQGMELHVLRGFGELLKAFSFLNIECSRVPLYEGGHPASEVIAYLDAMGFDQDSPIYDHDDIMFIRKGLKNAN